MLKEDPRLYDIARRVTEEILGGAPFAIGDQVVHSSGRTVRIEAGQYWGQHGLSNHWSWREVFADGKLGPLESGYGWSLSDPTQKD